MCALIHFLTNYVILTCNYQVVDRYHRCLILRNTVCFFLKSRLKCYNQWFFLELKHYPKFGLNRVVVQPEILNNCSSSSSANSNSSTLNAEKLLNSLTTNNNGGSNHHALTTTAAVTLASTPSTVAAPVPALVIASDATGNVLLSSQTKGIPGPHSPAVTPMGSVDLATLPETLSGNSSQTASVYTAATSGLV